MSTVKRPRIEPWIAERIDTVRDKDSFEAWVNSALDNAVGRLWIEPDPEKPRRFIVKTDENVLSTGLTKRDAQDVVDLLRDAHATIGHLTRLSDNASALGAHKVYEWAEATMHELDDLMEAIAARSYED